MNPIYTIAFFSGLAVMGIELSASRLIAPYFGTSLFVWTNVIGVILVALSLGYYLGGRLSEKWPQLKTLLYILLVAGVMVAIIPFVVRPVASLFTFETTAFTSGSAFIVIGSFLLTLSLFFIPVLLLGMTSPFLIKLVSLERKDIGNVSGRIFAVSTLGSIIGTFLPALVFVPLMGTKFTILIFASIIIIMGLSGVAPRGLFVMIPLLIIPFSTLSAELKQSSYLVAEEESAYQYIQVLEKDGMRYLVYNEGGGVQSVYHPDQVFYGGGYYDVAALLPSLTDGKRVLIVGLAGGTISRAMQSLYGDEPSFHIDGVEIDKKVIAVAEKFFGLGQPDLSIIHADGRNIVSRGVGEYDVIFIDAYSNQMYIPFQLTTQEFFMEVRDRLVPGGILAFNVNAASQDSELLTAITNTAASVFSHVYRKKVGDGWNYIIVAATQPIDFEEFRAASFSDDGFSDFAKTVPDGVELVDFDPGAAVLTDDWAPVEHMTDKMLWKEFVRRLK